jgi:dimethylamine/trimethylamine dehydrogenase
VNDNVYAQVADIATEVLTPDDIMNGKVPSGHTVVYDDDGYYMGSVVCERIRAQGASVTLVTPLDSVSAWAEMTVERWRIRTHLMKIGVEIVTSHGISWFDGREVTLYCQYSRRELTLPAKSLVVVGQRAPSDELYQDLIAGKGGVGALPFSLTRIGDCDAPAIIAAAVNSGHAYAQDIDRSVDIDMPIKHERIDVGLVAPEIWKVGTSL